MYPLIEMYEQGEMSATEFCYKENIAPHIFYYWISKYRNEHHGKSKFIDIAINDVKALKTKAETQTQSGIIRVQYPSGLIVEIPV